MPSIESLNFEVILDHTKFDKEVEKVKALAKGLNVEVSKALDLKKRISDADAKLLVNAEKVRQAEQKTATEVQKTATEKAKTAILEQKLANEALRTKSATQATTGAVKGTNAQLVTSNALMRTLSQLTGVAFSVIGIRRFLSSLIDVTGQFEVQKMALRSMLQDIDAADKIYQDLYRFSSESTYRFSELAKYAKQLAAFNIPKEDILETTKMLGDVASGVGVSMERIILAYGQVKSSGFLRGIQLRSFAQNGVPILEELAKQFSEIENRAVSLGEVFDKMMKREIPFEMVEEGFRRMTSEGGKFYQMQEVLAKTLAGQINILKGRWENFLAALGDSQSGALKGVVSSLSEMISSTEKFGHAIKTAIVGIGAYEAALVVAAVATRNLAIANGIVTTTLLKIFDLIKNNPWAIMATAVAMVAVSIYQFNTALDDTQKIYKACEDGIRGFTAELAAEDAELERLYARLKLAKEGTEEYDKAKLAIEGRFGPYIQQLREEGRAVDNLANIYGDLSRKIRESIQAKFLESVSSSLSSELKNATDNIYKSFQETAKRRNWSIAQQEDIWRYIVTGELSNENNRSLLSESGGGTIGLPGTFFFKDYGRSASSLRADMKDATDAFNKSMKAIEDVFLYDRSGSGKSGMGKVAEDFNYNVDSIIAGIKKLDSEIESIRNKARRGSITQSEKNTLDELVKDRAAQASIYKDIMGVDYDKDMRSVGKTSNKKKTIGEVVDEIIEDTGHDINKDIDKMTQESLKALDKELDTYFKAVKEWSGFMDKVAHTSGAKEGEGAAFKLTGFLLESKKEDYANLLVYRQQLKNLGTQFDESSVAFKNGKKALDEWKKTVDESSRNKLTEKVRGLAKDIMKEGLVGYDLSDWGDKSLSQINEIRKALMEMDIPDNIKKELSEDEELLSLLVEELKKLSQSTINNTVDPERWKKIAKQAKYISDRILTVGKSLKGLIDASGNRSLSAQVDALIGAMEMFKAGYEGYKTGGWIGAFIGGYTDMLRQAIDSAAEMEERAKKIRESITSIFYDSEVQNFRDSLEKAGNGIFGENTVNRVGRAVDEIKKLTEETVRLGEASTMTMAAWTEFVMPEWNGNSGGWVSKSAHASIAQLAQQLNKSLYDDYGNINPELISAIKSAGFELTEDELEMLNEAEAYALKYAEAMKTVEEAMSSLFDNIASDAADKIIDSWIEAGDAALDYAEILDDVAKSYSKMLIQSMITETALDPITEDLKSAFMEGRYGDAMEMVAGAMQAITDAAPMYEEVLKTFDPYFLRGDGSGSGSLGNGIKGITEDTANLLASYLNAIRADVSVIRGLQERGFASIGSLGESIPTLNDYIARIAATNFDIAQSNQRILTELQSVIGSQGQSGQIVRVEVVR